MIVTVVQFVVALLLVLGPLVFVHELGHFLVAKSLGIGVNVFSFGMGPRLFGWRRGGTDYRVSALPIGGYVRMVGEEADDPRSGSSEEFLSRPKWQRLLVFVAGASFNIALALVVLWGFFAVYGKNETPDYPSVVRLQPGSSAERAGVVAGDKLIRIAGHDVKETEDFFNVYNMEILLAPNAMKQLVLERDGVRREVALDTGADPKYGHGDPGWVVSWSGAGPPVIDSLLAGDRAEAAGLKVGDRILSAAGREPITEIELRVLLAESAERAVPLKVERDGQTQETTVTPRSNEGRGWIGVTFRRHTIHRELSVGQAAVESLRTNLALSKTLLVVVKRLVTHELPLRNLSGPLGIAQVARQALLNGPQDFLWLLGFFSLQLGILNLLPIPVLDGGHILILLVEAVLARELSERLKERVMQVGFVFLITLMGVVLYFDFVKL